MKVGPLGLWELLLLFIAFGLPLWAVIAAAMKRRLTVTARILLIGIAVLAPLVGSIGVLTPLPLLEKRQAV